VLSLGVKASGISVPASVMTKEEMKMPVKTP
jgi:hypothetical protein